MGEALYRKYRSRSLEEVIGQEHITTTLKNALKKGNISHAYLFTGPRGVGKTSIARILAYAINDIPYDDNSQNNMDIIEIDAASNRRIDEIRELRDKINIAPSSAKYKVYIIDEVHMLTREAFNALLKTLEEPPAHAVFILATTEVHKLPETIVSRTQRFTFKPITTDKAVEHLMNLAKSESIDIDKESLKLIAEHGSGSFRDSISMLDQMSSQNETISVDDVRRVVGIPPESSVDSLLNLIQTHDVASLVDELEKLSNQGYQASQIAKQLSKRLRTKENLEHNDMEFLKSLLNVPTSHDSQTYLELILIQQALMDKPVQSNAMTNSENTDSPKDMDSTKITKSAPKQNSPTPQPKTTSTVAAKKSTDNNDFWKETLQALKGKHNTLYGIARMGEAHLDNSKLILSFAFPFHQRRCNESRNRDKIESVMHEITGKKITLECVTSKPSHTNVQKTTKHKPKQNEKSDTLDSITEVFGGGEILE